MIILNVTKWSTVPRRSSKKLQEDENTELEVKVETTKLGEQGAIGWELEIVKVKEEIKVEDISQGIMKQELETKIRNEIE